MYDTYAPNHASLSLSNYRFISEQSEIRLRFGRSIIDGRGYENCAPGAKVSFLTDAEYLQFEVFYNNLLTQTSPKNSIGVIRVNGFVYKTFTTSAAANQTSAESVSVSFLGKLQRHIELIFPYRAGLDLTGIKLQSGASFHPGYGWKNNKIVTVGDSITHGSLASNISNSWPFKLSEIMGRSLINEGYGSRITVASDGSAIGGIDSDVFCYLSGYNDFDQQIDLDTFKSSYKGFINNFRAMKASAKLYLITPIYTPNVKAIPISDYRGKITESYNESLPDSNLYLIDGLSLMRNDTSLLSDTIHPNDAGCDEIAHNLSLIF